MEKFTLTSDTSRLPVVNMQTGRVVSRGFTPFFDKETLAFSYLAMSAEGGGDIFIPFSAIVIVNDVCLMVNLPNTPYYPEFDDCCELIGTPLTAKAGAVSLFSFGSIAKADIEGNGEIVSLTLNDGHSFLVPREGSPENGVVNDAFASEAFNIVNNTSRVPSSSQPEKSYAKEPEQKNSAYPEPGFYSLNSPEPEIREAESPAAANEPAEPKKTVMPERYEAPERHADPKPEFVMPKQESVPGPAPEKAPEMRYYRPPVQQTPPVQPVQSVQPEERFLSQPEPGSAQTGGRKKKKKKSKFMRLIARFAPPIAAMLVFFVLYFIMAMLFIK